MGRTCTRRHHVIVKTGLDLDTTSTQKVETVSEYSISEAAAKLDVTTRTLRNSGGVTQQSGNNPSSAPPVAQDLADLHFLVPFVLFASLRWANLQDPCACGSCQIAEELPQLARTLLPLMRARRRCGCCRWTFRSRGRCPRALHFRGRRVGECKKSADLQISLKRPGLMGLGGANLLIFCILCSSKACARLVHWA